MAQNYQATIQSKAAIQATKTLVNTAPGVGQLATYRFGVDLAPTPAPADLAQFIPGGRATGEWLDPSFRNPYSHQFNVGVSRQLSKSIALSIDYVRSLEKDDFSLLNINALVNGVPRLASDFGRVLGDPNNLSSVNIHGNLGQSRYDQLSFSVTGRAPRTTFQASYTLSGAYGYGVRAGSDTPTAAQIADDPRAPGEWGP